MIACPRCQSSARVQIASGIAEAREQGSAHHSIRWALRCDECGADWSIVDEIHAAHDGSPLGDDTSRQAPPA